MAVAITTSFGQLYLSAQLPDTIDMGTQDANEGVTVSVHEEDGTAIFSADLHAVGTSIKFYDIRTVIETYLRHNALNVANFYVKVENEAGDDDQSTLFTVVLSEFDIYQANNWLAAHFLSTRSYFDVSPSDTQLLSWYEGSGETITYIIEATVKLANGTLTTLTWPQATVTTGAGTVEDYTLSVASVISHFASGGQVLAFKVYRGANRVMEFIVSRPSNNLNFRFLNAFDVVEYVNMRGVTKAKQSMNASEAEVLRTTVKYDWERETVYDVESEALTIEQAKWLGQFLTSKHIEVKCSDGQWRTILVDGTAEASGSKSEANRLKFSWKFAKNVMIM